MSGPQPQNVLPPRAFHVQTRMEDKLLWDPKHSDDVESRLLKFCNIAQSLEEQNEPQSVWCSRIWQKLLKRALEMELCNAFPLRPTRWLKDMEPKRFLSLEPMQREFQSNPEEASSTVDISIVYDSTRRAAGYNGRRHHSNPSSPILSHMAGDCLSKSALFSAIKIAAPGGDLAQVEHELKDWMVASLRKKLELAGSARLHNTEALVEPFFAIVGPQVYVYLAYTDDLAPHGIRTVRLESKAFSCCHTDNPLGVWRILTLFRNFFVYAIDESPAGYIGGFMGAVLKRFVVRNSTSPASSSPTTTALVTAEQNRSSHPSARERVTNSSSVEMKRTTASPCRAAKRVRVC